MRDLAEASVYDGYAVPKLYLKQYYCISAAEERRANAFTRLRQAKADVEQMIAQQEKW